ncbi:DUF4193 domain-containing protein [Arthrobacter parietis]|uniref:DUF4193 domain-containing protein n=2 Tax=Arthrobacter TaxID=1663 RepID=A0ABT6D224_9MICC|nr:MULTISPECIES: DUF4193 domain-containing protein [Arthrobacter]KRF08674.1 dUTPase [Arthrobacter sp. Soil782]MDF9279074.1 DUF4193 domain-containing protein [Arthrobacter vasquezii]
MATDYDAPRVREEDQPANESLEALKAQRSASTQNSAIDADETDTAEGLDLPGAVLEEELQIQVIPEQQDEFTCMSCFLVRHRSQLAREKNGNKYCADCEG